MSDPELLLPLDYIFNLERFIKYFEEENIKRPGQRIEIQQNDCIAICLIVRKLFQQESTLIEVPAPIKICGDIHGQWSDLMKIFRFCGAPGNGRYLFLGDYVDRGICSLETICVLFAYKIKYPNRIFLLRGNHESTVINKVYGFFQELEERFSNESLFILFNNVFKYLPIAAIVNETIFCCHGGLSPVLLTDEVNDLKQEILKISRPIDIPAEGLICDLLWSDPIDLKDDEFIDKGWGLNSRGCSFVFNDVIVHAFLEKFNLELIVRAHQVVPDGYEFFCNRSLVTVFSVSNYCGTFDNAAAVLLIEKKPNFDKFTLHGGFQIITADKINPSKWVKLKKKKKKKKKDKSKKNKNSLENSKTKYVSDSSKSDDKKTKLSDGNKHKNIPDANKTKHLSDNDEKKTKTASDGNKNKNLTEPLKTIIESDNEEQKNETVTDVNKVTSDTNKTTNSIESINSEESNSSKSG